MTEKFFFEYFETDVSCKARIRALLATFNAYNPGKALHYRWAEGRISDEHVFEHCSSSDLYELTGPAGSGVIVDTTNSLHYGSRARQSDRIVFMFQFTGFPDIKVEKEKLQSEVDQECT